MLCHIPKMVATASITPSTLNQGPEEIGFDNFAAPCLGPQASVDNGLVATLGHEMNTPKKSMYH